MRSKGLLLFTLFAARWATAGVVIITNTNDSTAVDTLRGAIIAANTNQWDKNNYIILDGSGCSNIGGCAYYLTVSGSDETNSFSGDLNVTSGNLTIIGLGSNVTIDATGLGDRVFDVHGNASLTLVNLTVTGGASPGDDLGWTWGGEPGGGIWNSGKLIMDGCTVKGNWSGHGFQGGSQAFGGGIYNLGTLEMDNCLIVGNFCGRADVQGGPGSDGGGLYNVGTASLRKCTVSGNQAGLGGPANAAGVGGDGGKGGGIYNAGFMALDECIVSANSAGKGSPGGLGLYMWDFDIGGPGGAGGDGGGIYNSGNLVLEFSTVSSNLCGEGSMGGGFYSPAGNGGNGGSGGGIFNDGNATLETSTISGNLCGKGGSGGEALIQGLGDGAGGGNGGGIFNAGSLAVTACTIAFNASGAGGSGGNSANVGSASSGGPGGQGGGIFSLSTNVTITVVRNTLVASNWFGLGGSGGMNRDYPNGFSGSFTQQTGAEGTNGFGPDLCGMVTSGGYNLIGMSDGGSGLTNTLKWDQVGSIAAPIAPLIGGLQFNDGFTPTHALLEGSPAIDQGKNFGTHVDQCGRARPYDIPFIGNAPQGDGADIGAFEFNAVTWVAPVLVVNDGHSISDRFEIQIFAPNQQPNVIQRSLDLVHWRDIGTVTGATVFADTNTATQTVGFYRTKP